MTIKIYHCSGARSMRPVWTAEEMGLDYTVEVLPFPPRVLHKEYKKVNPLGTIPYMIDGDVRMTESSAISQYFADRYGPTPLAVAVDEPDYGAYLNWLHHADATITFPLTVYLRYTRLEPEERRLPQAAADYKAFFLGRLRLLEQTVAARDYLCCDRFTIADICVGFALHLAQSLGISEAFTPHIQSYWERITARPAYHKTAAL